MKPELCGHEVEGRIVSAQSQPTPLNQKASKARHDLNNSIAHILGFAEMWLEEIPEEDANLRSHLDVIFRTAQRMMAQVGEHLGATQVEKGAMNYARLQR